MFKKILVPLDGSKLAEQALPYAIEVARKFGSKIVLLRCMVMQVPALTGVDVTLPEISTELERIEREQIEKYLGEVGRWPELQDLVIETRAPYGVPGEEILEFAVSEGCDLIVMSSHGRSGVRRFIYGSVAEKVLHHATCPLMLIRVKD